MEPFRGRKRIPNGVWAIALIGCVALAFLYWGPKTPKATARVVPGWDDLLDCSDMISLDGTEHLALSDDHSVLFENEHRSKDADGKRDDSIRGAWSFDEISKRYAVTLNGATTTYSVIQVPDSGLCMLIRGELGSVNLRESWFSVATDNFEEDHDRDPPGAE
jgi:hypothetical protein